MGRVVSTFEEFSADDLGKHGGVGIVAVLASSSWSDLAGGENVSSLLRARRS
jgi:hypothetical protein